MCKANQNFGAPDALWQRWISGSAGCFEGSTVVRSDVAVIIIAYKSQATVLECVQSVLQQSVAAEVVVVNSGGGAIFDILASVQEKLRIININKPVKVGAARNIGIDASTAPYISFLAADCLAATWGG